MSNYEYRVIAAPTKGVKAKGRKSAEDRFSNALELKINEMAREGWEYQRAEALPSTERAGLTSTKTVWHNLLVFRRAVLVTTQETPAALPAPDPATPQIEKAMDPTRKTPPVVSPKPKTPDTANTPEPITAEADGSEGSQGPDSPSDSEKISEAQSDKATS
jgi:hypothetical protein